MVAVRNLALGFASVLLVAVTGCATTHGNLASSADRLEHNAHEMARDARGEPDATGYSAGSYMENAHELAEDARALRRTAEERGTDSRDVKDAFERVSLSYHDLRDKVERTDSREARSDLKPVTEAYLDVERAMGGYHDRHAYARDADARDRGYDDRY